DISCLVSHICIIESDTTGEPWRTGKHQEGEKTFPMRSSRGSLLQLGKQGCCSSLSIDREDREKRNKAPLASIPVGSLRFPGAYLSRKFASDITFDEEDVGDCFQYLQTGSSLL